MLISVAINIIFSAILASLGIYMLKGNGWSMINLPEGTKAKWDKRALCRFVGKYILFFAFCFLLMAIGVLVNLRGTLFISLGLMPAGSAVLLIKVFRPNESQKAKQEIPK